MDKSDIVAMPPMPCDLNRGDTVTFTNDYDVEFEGMIISGFSDPSEGRPEAFIHLEKESWWFPLKREQLTLEKRYKSPSASKVLKLMDSYEDAAGDYALFVKQVAAEDNIPVAQLERELNPFI